VQAVVEIHERIGGPDFRSQLLARHQLAGVSEQRSKDVQRLPLKAPLHSVLAQFASTNVEVEHAEAKDSTGWGRGRHAGEPVRTGYHSLCCPISTKHNGHTNLPMEKTLGREGGCEDCSASLRALQSRLERIQKAHPIG